MLGDSNSGCLLGLSEAGKNLVSKLENGCEVERNELTQEELELFDFICQQGFLTSSTPTVEIPRAAYLHVTNRCNMSCKGCYSGAFRDNCKQDPLSLTDIKNVVDNLAGANVSSIIISGGEPFLRKDIIDIFSYIKEIKKIASLTCITNGTASYEDYSCGAKFLDRIAFSMDGYSKETSYLRWSAFEKTIDSIKKLKSEGFNPAIIFTLHHQNSSYVKEMENFANSLGVPYNFSLFTVKPSAETAALQLDEMDVDLIVRNNGLEISDTPATDGFGCRVCCGAGRSLISVCANGDIMPCHMFTDKRFCMGNALTDDISAIFLNNNKPLVHVDDREACVGCEFKYICGGGCPARTYLQSGSFAEADPLCSLNKAGIISTLDSLIG